MAVLQLMRCQVFYGQTAPFGHAIELPFEGFVSISILIVDWLARGAVCLWKAKTIRT